MLMLLTVVACKDDEVDASCKESRLLYQSISGNIKLTTEYEYDSLDRIKRISRKRSTPGTTQGVDYDYNTDGQLEKVDRIVAKVALDLFAPIQLDLLSSLPTIFTRCLNIQATIPD